MNDPTCPICNKTNPGTVENCQYCGTKLRQSPTEPAQTIHPGEIPKIKKISGLDSTLSDELAVESKTSQKDKNLSTPKDQNPINNLKDSQPGQREKNNLDSLSLSDFLAGLSKLNENEEEQETPEWLKNLQSSLPDNDQVIQTEEKQHIEKGFDSDQILGEIGLSELTILPEDKMGFSGEAPINEFDKNFEPVRENAASAPDWLDELLAKDKSIEPIPEEAQIATHTSPETSIEADLPDWLAALTTTAVELNPLPADNPISKQQPSIMKQENPDWLANLGGEFTPEEGAIEAGLPVPANAETPDWLIRMGADAQAPEETVSTEISFPPDQPNWIYNQQAPVSTPFQPADEHETPGLSPFANQPDWLANHDGAQSSSTVRPFIPENVTSGEKPAQTQKPFQTGSYEQSLAVSLRSEVPSGLSAPTREETPYPTSSETPEELISSSEAAQFIEIESFNTVLPEEKNIDSVLSMDAPDWLSSLPSKESLQSITPDEEIGAAADLNPGVLPTWVQAMRPMESVMAESDDNGDVEDQGPLAGLLSVLPIRPDLNEKRPTSKLTINLVPNETQQAQAALLENLLKSESYTLPFSKRPKEETNNPLRWFIAGILLFMIIVFAVLGLKLFPTPVLLDEKNPISPFFQTISALPENAPILLVMDYQPAFAGEIEVAAGPVLEQLMSKQSRLAFISTSPLGELMVNRLLQKFEKYSYKTETQFIYLGYLPGGAAGIQAFANQPRSTLGLNSVYADLWETSILSDVTVNSETKLSNFAAVIVATDNPDTGRLWIEQALPFLMGKPMLMVVSAQAEPMLRPYLLSNQLRGLLAGLEGGVLYENALGKTGLARTYWDLFGVSMVVTDVIFLIGGLWNLFSGIRSQSNPNAKDKV